LTASATLSDADIRARDDCCKAVLFVVIGAGTFSHISGLFLYFIGIKLFYSFDVGE
jgi:hypothetical protein